MRYNNPQVPDSTRDAIYAVVYVFSRDPGGGENIEVIERGSVLVLAGSQQSDSNALSGVSPGVTVEHVTSERGLLLRIASIVTMKDPDILLSWDTHGAGIGYIVERGVALGKSADGSLSIDMARLLGRIPKCASSADSNKTVDMNQEMHLLDGDSGKDNNNVWAGSGLGSEWDDRVGAGAAAASIVSSDLTCFLRLLGQSNDNVAQPLRLEGL